MEGACGGQGFHFLLQYALPFSDSLVCSGRRSRCCFPGLLLWIWYIFHFWWAPKFKPARIKLTSLLMTRMKPSKLYLQSYKVHRLLCREERHKAGHNRCNGQPKEEAGRMHVGCGQNIQWILKLKNIINDTLPVITFKILLSPWTHLSYSCHVAVVQVPFPEGVSRLWKKNTVNASAKGRSAERQAYENVRAGPHLVHLPDLPLWDFWLLPKVKMTMEVKILNLIRTLRKPDSVSQRHSWKRTSVVASESGRMIE